jgi:ATP-binding cassette, subfamily B, bacterial MsbA
MGALGRIEAVLHADPLISDTPNALVMMPFEHSIRFREVSFTYPNACQTTLQNIDFEIPKGQMVALVGPSGAGKSTIADLLPRFFDVQSGAILIDGVDIKTIKMESLRVQFGLVGQDPILFHDTVRANLTLGNSTYSDAQLWAALEKSNATDFVQALPFGLDTDLGERGNKLSGGQRQRLTIARALLRDPAILILDEATSALDSASEQLVQAAVDKLLQDRTALVIAHRLSTVMHADKIVVLDAGAVVAQGTHQELLLHCDLYRELVELQRL